MCYETLVSIAVNGEMQYVHNNLHVRFMRACSGNAESQPEAVIEHMVGRQGEPRGAQMCAMYMSDWKKWSQDPLPPRRHLRVGKSLPT